MPMASDAFVPGGRAQLPQLLEEAAGDVHMDPEGVGAQQLASGDAHRQPVRIVGGQRVGDPVGMFPTDRAAVMSRLVAPRCRAHVPAIGGVQITGGLQMLGDQRSVLLGRCRVT